MGDAAFRAQACRIRNWGRWGPDDERGTLNFITPQHVAQAVRLARRGVVFDLALPVDATTPRPGGLRQPPAHFMTETGVGQDFPGGFRYADDYVLLALQGSTQWDALAHVHYDGRLYNGYPAETVSPGGATRNGVDKVAPGVVGRGVLLDVARCQGRRWLEPGDVISPEDLDAAMAAQGVAVGQGDVVLVRTGWLVSWRDAGGRADALRGEPGLGVDCTEWLAARSVAAVATDNYAVEVLPGERRGIMLPFHMLALRDMGLTLGELFDLEALAEDCAAEGTYEFLFVGTVMKVPGAVGSPVTPIAIR